VVRRKSQQGSWPTKKKNLMEVPVEGSLLMQPGLPGMTRRCSRSDAQTDGEAELRGKRPRTWKEP